MITNFVSELNHIIFLSVQSKLGLTYDFQGMGFVVLRNLYLDSVIVSNFS